ncbi:MAG: hypothetical protein RR646_01715 [Erysipelotrichaceae bacterium]
MKKKIKLLLPVIIILFFIGVITITLYEQNKSNNNTYNPINSEFVNYATLPSFISEKNKDKKDVYLMFVDSTKSESDYFSNLILSISYEYNNHIFEDIYKVDVAKADSLALEELKIKYNFTSLPALTKVHYDDMMFSADQSNDMKTKEAIVVDSTYTYDNKRDINENALKDYMIDVNLVTKQ